MSEAFRLGGWGMYPTAVMGLILLLTAVLYAVRPQARLLRVCVALGVTTFFLGCLGFITGVIKTLEGAGSHSFTGSSVDIAMIGVSESLYNLALAIVFLVLACFGIIGGLVRRPRAEHVKATVNDHVDEDDHASANGLTNSPCSRPADAPREGCLKAVERSARCGMYPPRAPARDGESHEGAHPFPDQT